MSYYAELVRAHQQNKRLLARPEDAWPEQVEHLPRWVAESAEALLRGTHSRAKSWPKEPATFVHFTTPAAAKQIAKEGFLRADSAPNGYGCYAYHVSESWDDCTTDRRARRSPLKVAVWFETDVPYHSSGETKWPTDIRVSVKKITSAVEADDFLAPVWAANSVL